MKKTVLAFFTILCLLSTIFLMGLALNIQQVKATGTMYIRADGSIDPPTANMTSADNIIYYFTDNINDSIVVERSNIVIDGNGYTVQGAGAYDSKGVHLAGENNVTITNMTIKAFHKGIEVYQSSNNSIYANNFVDNSLGIFLWGHWKDPVCSYNTIFGNNMINNGREVLISMAWNNTFFNNNFIDDLISLDIGGYTNFWDNSVEGNYWSDYAGEDQNGDGIGDTPYDIDVANQDNYPLMGMFSVFDATSEYDVQTICNSTISDFQFDGTAIRFIVSGEDGTTGFCRISIPTALIPNEPDTYHVFVNGTEVSHTLLPFSNSTRSYLYFTYNHSTKEVVIIPEFPSFLILPLFMIATLLATIVYRRKHSV